MATGRLLDLVREHRDEVQAAVERHRGLSFTEAARAARAEMASGEVAIPWDEVKADLGLS